MSFLFNIEEYLYNEKPKLDYEEAKVRWNALEVWCTERMGPRPGHAREDLNLERHKWSGSMMSYIGDVPRAVYIKDEVDAVAFKLVFMR